MTSRSADAVASDFARDLAFVAEAAKLIMTDQVDATVPKEEKPADGSSGK